jgi:lysophospholipase L1-like esterase
MTPPELGLGLGLARPLASSLVGGDGAESIDPDVAEYAATVSLGADETLLLSRHVKDIKSLGLTIKLMGAYASKFKSRSGAALRHIIGGTATVTGGSVVDGVTGQEFNGANGNFIEIPNPKKGTALTEIGMFSVADTLATTATQPLISGNRLASARGPELIQNNTSQGGSVAGVTGAQYTVDGATFSGASTWTTFWLSNHGGMMTTAASLKLATILVFGDARFGRQSGLSNAGIWNNNTNWSIGSRAVNTTCITGVMAYALVTDEALDESKYIAICRSGKRNGIWTPTKTKVSFGLGDSLMAAGAPGLTAANELLQQLTYSRANNWSPVCSAVNYAVGGTGWTNYSGTQIPLVIAGWGSATEFGRWAIHFGGHNDTAYRSTSEATRNAMVDNYIGAWEQLAALGCSIMVISPIENSTWDAPTLAATSAYRAYLSAQVAARGWAYINLHADSDFSVATRNSAYFLDPIHLSGAGYTRVAEMIEAQVPNP